MTLLYAGISLNIFLFTLVKFLTLLSDVQSGEWISMHLRFLPLYRYSNVNVSIQIQIYENNKGLEEPLTSC